MEHETTTAVVEDERAVALTPAAAVVLAETGRTAEGHEGEAWFARDGMIDDAAVHDGREDCAVGLHGGHDGEAVFFGQERPDGVE